MRVTLGQGDLSSQRVDVAACFAYQGDREPRGVKSGPLCRELAQRMKAERFRGRRGQSVAWNADGPHRGRRYLVVGLGSPTVPAEQAVRQGAARAARLAVRSNAASLALRLPPVPAAAAAAHVRAAVEGALAGCYRFDRYLTDPARRPTRLTRLHLLADGPAAALRAAARRGELTGRAVALARDLVNEPPSTLGPVELAARAADAAAAAGLTAEILDADAIERLGMGALLAVSRGSGSGPRVVHLTYTPRRGQAPRRVVLVGKGVTFDSGGLDLKTSAGMIHMKADMAGAAAVLAAMTVLGRIGCRAEVHAFLGLVENMTGEAAYKPGDILATYSGKTVEVTNTDAEGRLVLCDLLAYACATLRPDAVVDLATLTGACVVALGPSASGLFCRDEALRAALLEAGSQAGERLWPMPLYDDYLESLRRGPADLRNSGDRYGGAIIAALFLGEFVPRNIPWGHLDIAGPAFLEADGPEATAGGTGAGVGTALRWLESL